jgi:predicted nucleotide-binding protein (sugar kinase/HSP70/actin superfamily)
MEENLRAVQAGYAALAKFDADMRKRAREVIEKLEAEQKIGIVVLARPYHSDPGVNHEILEEFQKLGYPVLTQDSLPIDDDILERLFGEEVRRGDIPHALAVTDVWKNSYSENTTRKVWASKFTARHPNLVALELSSFKCGHDAPIYTVVEEIIQDAGTPYFSFKDIDENKPTGSIKIRVETIAYFLKRYREDMVRDGAKKSKVAEQLRMYEHALRQAIAEGRSPEDIDLAAILKATEAQPESAPAASEAAMYAGALHKK